MLGTCSTHVTESRMEASLSEDLILPSPENSSNGKRKIGLLGKALPDSKMKGQQFPRMGAEETGDWTLQYCLVLSSTFPSAYNSV